MTNPLATKTDTPEDCLDLAYMHIECLREAWHEYSEAFKPVAPERRAVVAREIEIRIQAISLLVANRSNPEKLAEIHAREVLVESWLYGDPDGECDDEPTVEQVH